MREAIAMPGRYPANILTALEKASNSEISIANRWMLGWPERVDRMIASGTYLEMLKNQASLETEAWVVAVENGQEHLAPWEINQQAGLDPEPPAL